MLKVMTTIAATMIFTFAWAEDAAKPATMQDHDKAVEMCKSLKVKGDCKKLADQCHGQADLKACITEKAKAPTK